MPTGLSRSNPLHVFSTLGRLENTPPSSVQSGEHLKALELRSEAFRMWVGLSSALANNAAKSESRVP